MKILRCHHTLYAEAILKGFNIYIYIYIYRERERERDLNPINFKILLEFLKGTFKN